MLNSLWCTHLLPSFAQSRLSTFFSELENLLSDDDKQQLNIFLDQEGLGQLHRVLIASDFVQHQLLKNPSWLLRILKEQRHNELSLTDYWQAWAGSVSALDEVEEFDRQLRQFRHFHMLRIIWRDCCRIASMPAITRELSYLAEVCVMGAIAFHQPRLSAELGEPVDADGEAQTLLIIAMGKLGAYELNLSSDIDLIFAYANRGETQSASPVSNQVYFERLGRRLIQSLDRTTADGHGFRIDMRLRPFGQSGALVSHFDALEDYYQTQGRDWERYAMIKARILGKQNEVSARLSEILHAFTYRRYVDFAMIEALRQLKAMIKQEERRRKLGDNIKLGSGGIREIEFIAQVFQLIRGGRDTELQDNRLLVILPRLEQLRCLPKGRADDPATAYTFLRNTEHALQALQDKQTQTLPSNPDNQARIAWVMGFGDWQSFLAELDRHRALVSKEFSHVISAKDDDNNAAERAGWTIMWQQLPELGVTESALLEGAGYQNTEHAVSLLTDLRRSPTVARLQPAVRERLDQFMPKLLSAISETPTPDMTLERILDLVKGVLRRSAYLVLLNENNGALQQLVKLAQASPWIASELAEHPALLDELLDQRTLYQLPSREELQDNLRRELLRISEDDLEAQMESLRYFRSSHGLRVAACEVVGSLPLMQVSDYLTFLAEIILQHILHLCWRQLVTQYGCPADSSPEQANFIIVGYGKLGGIEMGHGSDLDMVFVYDGDSQGSTQTTSADQRSIENAVFYTRLGQKIIHMLDARMTSGQLYEIDMRLRPSGNSGMLVSSLDAFEKYQQTLAWTWEHQALVRARPVAGNAQLQEKFMGLRHRILAQPRNNEQLKADVVTMREKMREHLGSDLDGKGDKQFHIKHDPGGIVDIEFMVQYAVLAWAYEHPDIVTYTDNIRILERLAQAGKLNAQQAQQLTSAYKAFRAKSHQLALQQQPNLVDPSLLAEERAVVVSLWQQLLGPASSGTTP